MVDSSPESSLLGKIAGYTEILVKDPRSTVFVPLSEAYRKMGMLDDAIAVAGKGVKTLATYAPGFIALGRALAEKGEWERSAEAFERTLALEAGNLQGLKGLVRVRVTLQQHDAARQLLQRILVLAPDDEWAAKMLASSTSTDSMHKTAVSPAPQQTQPAVVASAGDTEPPIATATLAEIYERQGLLRKAFKIYRELYQADATNHGLYDKLVDLKRRIEAGEEGAAPSASSPASSATAAPQAATPVSPAPAAGPTSAEKTIEVYDRWLASIRRRRENVR